MAYAFNGSNQWLSVASAPLANIPFTLSANFKKTGTATKNGVFLRNADYMLAGFYFGSSSSVRGYFQGMTIADWSLGTYSTGQKHHVCITGSSTTSRAGHFDGGSAVTNTTFNTLSDFNSLHIAAVSGGYAFDGEMSEIAVWNQVLNQSEIEALSDGVSASLVRPSALVFYAPLIRDLADIRGGLSITNNNSATVADHPRIYL